jgi:hypothetical protein
MATHVPDGHLPESRVTRFARWVKNAHVTEEGYCIPYATILLQPLAVPTLVLVIDGSVVGRGCVALMLHAVSKGRALPLAWQVRQGAQGHFPEDLHSALVQQGHKRVPPGASVVLLGDGACDGIRRQHTLHAYRWSSVVRTGSHITVMWDGDHCRCATGAACLKPGTLVEWRDVRVTAEAYGPLMLLCCWAKGSTDPLYLGTHMAAADEACRL